MARGVALGVRHRVKTQRTLPPCPEQRERAETGAVPVQGGQVFQHERVAHAVIRVHGRRQALGHEPLGERPFGKVVAARGGVGADGRDVLVHPHIAVQAVEVGEGQVGEVHLLACRPQRECERQPGVHVETAARTGDAYPPRVAQAGEERGFPQRDHRVTPAGG
ncbi:hypothetical protein SLA_6732 [Streptomyces laurentii]|uniref:Uncharacterized protein n=1 Tax=Streptomyces laurentii TaxID=39478 RepID=A0A169PFC0_STRLU|nr:hypothetical protein SLA_6732 [Streptomyces laurentii]